MRAERGYPESMRKTILTGVLIAAVTMTCLVSLPSRVFGQATEGSILGTVRDASGAPVPDVAITVTNALTNVGRKSQTNESGEYVVTNLAVGSYSIRAEKVGFKMAMQPPVDLTVKARVRVDLALTVGDVTQTVEVSSALALLKTDSVELSTVVGQHELESLPSISRNFLSLSVLTPNTMRYARPSDRVGEFSGGEAVQVGSQGEGSNNFILDGISNNIELTGGMNAVPPIDAVQEFSIQTSGYSAEFGRASGGIVNVALKSGTNLFHGFGYDYLQNDIFNARPYDFTGTNPAKQPLRRNLFGGGLGGPVRRNRIFIFGNYEGLRQPQSAIEYITGPTALEKQGNFSQSGYTIYDPSTLHSDAIGAQVRSAFPGNIIPANRINTAFAKLLAVFPDPNYKDPNPSVLSNFLAVDQNNDTRNSMNVKSDINLRPQDVLTARYSRQQLSKDRSGPLPGGWIGATADLNGTNAALLETHILSPSMVNEVRVGWNYVNDGNTNLNTTTFSDLNSIPGAIIIPGYPTASIRNIQSTKPVRPLTTLPTPYYVWQNSLQYMDNVSWRKGRHALKFGAEFFHHRNDVGGGGSPGGLKTNFDGYQTTVATPGGKRPTNGTGVADELLGLADQFTTYYNLDKTRMRDSRFAAFIQDEWRVTSKLSVSAGLRYDYLPSWSWKDDHGINFDLATGNILVSGDTRSYIQNVVGLPNGNLPPNYQYVPADRVRPHSTSIDLSPRIGLAYSLRSNLILRTGYGIFYSPLEALEVNNTGGAPFNFNVSLIGDTSTPIDVTKGFPSGSIYSAISSNAIAPAYYQPKYKDPYVQKYNVNLQYSPLKNTAIEVGYSGLQSIRESDTLRLNYPTPAPGDIQSRRPYPQWGEGFGVEFRGASRYNGLEVSVRQRVIHGFTIYSALTVEHTVGFNGSIDPYNFAYGYGTLATDYGKQWVTSVIYDAPKLASWSLPARTILGGWQATSIVQLHGGFPFSVNSSQTMNDDINSSRANLVLTNGPPALPNGQRTINQWFNVNAFVTPPDYVWGNSGIDILRGPGFAEVEMSVQKTFSLSERIRATFRAEAENALNHVNLGQPSATVGSAGLGTIRSLNGDPRTMQMSLRLQF